MPYPESCPECGSTFRNTGTHFTARRNEVGRHVLLELGCQNTTRRFWWDFTTGSLTEDGRPSSVRRPTLAETLSTTAASNGLHHAENNGSVHPETNGHAGLSTLEAPKNAESALSGLDLSNTLELGGKLDSGFAMPDSPKNRDSGSPAQEPSNDGAASPIELRRGPVLETELGLESHALDADVEAEPPAAVEPDHDSGSARKPESTPLAGTPAGGSDSLKDAFVRQLQLDRLTLRQMRSWLMSEEARRAIEVASGATEATYERLALILFGVELPQLLGKQAVAPQSTGMTAEERLELQREKARIRARLRRAAAKTARQTD